MESELSKILEQLEGIKESIRKLGSSRRVGSNFERKINDAKLLYETFQQLALCLTGDIPSAVILVCTRIKDTYSKILEYQKENSSNMSSVKFCLKTAVSLLPKMTGDENVTQDLIDAIELYDSMLDADQKQLLINFVLKSRLTIGVKMRLATSYTSVIELLKDMRTHLLTQKSDTALQAKLQTARQGEKSVQEFGEEIERLFVDLTISQANGNDSAYKILRPLNEKNAIKRFSEGLRSQKIGTIISARNLTSLKDAIRVAEDESSTSSNHPLMSYTPYMRGRGTRRGNYSYRPRGRIFNNSLNNNYNYGQQRVNAPVSTWRGRGGGGRGASGYRARYVPGKRGPNATRFNNGRYLHHFTAREQNTPNLEKNLDENPNLNEFFRV